MTGATSGLGLAAAQSMAELGATSASSGATRSGPNAPGARSPPRQAPRSRPSSPTSRPSRRPRPCGPLRRAARPARRARSQRRRAHPRVHGDGGGKRADTRDARPVAVPADPRAPAAARGVGPSRVIVVASGGMYTEPLDVDALDPDPPPTTARRHMRAANEHRSCSPTSGRGTCSTPASPSTRCTPAGPTRPGSGRRFPASAAPSVRSSARRRKVPTRSSGWPPPGGRAQRPVPARPASAGQAPSGPHTPSRRGP